MTYYYQDDQVTLHHGDALAVLRTMPDASVDCVVTSPPYYGLRDYGEPGQWVIDQMVRALCGVDYPDWRAAYEADGEKWDEGVSPQ